MTRLRVTLIFVSLLVLVAILPLIPDRIVVHMPKTGVVIDEETGKPMSNVIVIAAAWTSHGPVLFGPGGYADLYRIVTFTDEEGRYRIPSTWSEIVTGPPTYGTQNGWEVTVFMPGYAVVGDEKGWQFREDGSPIYKPRSTFAMPEFSYRGTFIEVAPLRMFKPTLNLKEAAFYYSEIKGVGAPFFASTEPGDIAIRQQGYALLAPWVCSMDPQTDLDRSTMGVGSVFSMDPINAIALSKQLDPLQSSSDAQQHPQYKAGIVCKIITNGRGVP